MKKINIVKSNEDFDRIIKCNKPFKYKSFVVYIEWTNDTCYHFGFCVSKKIGNAVTRNKIKRRIKSAISGFDYKNNFNCIIITGKGILNESFQELSDNLFFIFDKLSLFGGKKL